MNAFRHSKQRSKHCSTFINQTITNRDSRALRNLSSVQTKWLDFVAHASELIHKNEHQFIHCPVPGKTVQLPVKIVTLLCAQLFLDCHRTAIMVTLPLGNRVIPPPAAPRKDTDTLSQRPTIFLLTCTTRSLKGSRVSSYVAPGDT